MTTTNTTTTPKKKTHNRKKCNNKQNTKTSTLLILFSAFMCVCGLMRHQSYSTLANKQNEKKKNPTHIHIICGIMLWSERRHQHARAVMQNRLHCHRNELWNLWHCGWLGVRVPSMGRIFSIFICYTAAVAPVFFRAFVPANRRHQPVGNQFSMLRALGSYGWKKSQYTNAMELRREKAE